MRIKVSFISLSAYSKSSMVRFINECVNNNLLMEDEAQMLEEYLDGGDANVKTVKRIYSRFLLDRNNVPPMVFDLISRLVRNPSFRI